MRYHQLPPLRHSDVSRRGSSSTENQPKESSVSRTAVIAKAIIAFFGTLGTWGATALADGGLDPVEWFGLCGVVVATAAVWAIPNSGTEAVEA